MPKVTIYDVAKRAGVSTATVSKVLNGNGRISKVTSSRVEQAIADLHYRPSIIASALKRNQTYSIGLLVPDIINTFYSELARAIEDVALLQNYSVLVCSTDNSPEREGKQLDLLLRKQLDGIIIATSEGINSSTLDMLKKQEARVVFIDRIIANSPYPTVATDHYQGSYQITEYLIQLGHRKLAIFLEPLYLKTSLERLRGFSAALASYGIAQNSFSVLSNGFGAVAGYAMAQQVLENPDPPTAIVASNDLIAIGALQKFHESGVIIPEQLSLVGYDDIQMARMVSPSLTTVAQPIMEMGKLAFEYLFNDSMQTTATTLLSPTIVIRQTSAPPRPEGPLKSV
ncbi:LacI family transcriptional regulator [Ktedonosporobacter rubrisoli]|uniref:LacI family transcriptional regulator n=1 Tax=Ktedonosporobacter rubrisoli TaxID=2509675 RepID=A0A4P6JU54_KTERU|nr:LacI family DNA-binding transcriptional regulator [Ktedonosporobacter rubrisoli]QBD78853.1 LacI family transcriptional regulator [Ktedonosporobacter rubrisoli]